MVVADGRSPITAHWIEGLLALKHEVTLVSTYPCPQIPGVLATYVIPVAFGNFGGGQVSVNPSGRLVPSAGLQLAVKRARSLFLSGRYLLGPLTLFKYGNQFRSLVAGCKPDIVHALRIPFEAMLASYAPAGVPLAVSVWGNDLTLHAHGSPWMSALTRRTLKRANALMADASRDIRLGYQWGFQKGKPTLVVPGAGGINLVEIRRVRSENQAWLDDHLPLGMPVVINPRGFRPGSVRNDVFFQALPLVQERFPDVLFLCTAMAGQPEALRWVQRLNLRHHVRLLPYLPQSQLWDLFQHSEISVSLSSHDGTPNSLLEAMACGSFPLAGDIESIREWITPAINGLLIEPTKPQALAEALILALENPAMRTRAAELNLEIIRQRAEMNLVRAQLQVFYQRITA
ncbi:MAG: glycosyltransferase [Anaerolineaceae bacterium]|nr:glycosyltransferase [Anaerolineaceae bacterium]